LTAEFTQASYGDSVIAIEVLNEPFPQADWEMDFLKTFYTAAYDTVRAAAKHPNVVVAIDTAFNGLTTWDGFMTEPGWSGVALDTVSCRK
jgi:glucan 1,3-beta-glucosidase